MLPEGILKPAAKLYKADGNMGEAAAAMFCYICK